MKPYPFRTWPHHRARDGISWAVSGPQAVKYGTLTRWNDGIISSSFFDLAGALAPAEEFIWIRPWVSPNSRFRFRFLYVSVIALLFHCASWSRREIEVVRVATCKGKTPIRRDLVWNSGEYEIVEATYVWLGIPCIIYRGEYETIQEYLCIIRFKDCGLGLLDEPLGSIVI